MRTATKSEQVNVQNHYEILCFIGNMKEAIKFFDRDIKKLL